MPSKYVKKRKYDNPDKWLSLKVNIALKVLANEKNKVAK